jgi:hypothetical protein
MVARLNTHENVALAVGPTRVHVTSVKIIERTRAGPNTTFAASADPEKVEAANFGLSPQLDRIGDMIPAGFLD